PNDHSKLRAPVANVIIADHFVPKELRDARQSVAKQRAADVTDVHRLGRVGRAKINHNTPRRFCLSDTQPLVPEHLHCFFTNCAGTQSEVDKPWTRHAGGFAKIACVEVRDDFLCKNSRIFAALLPEHESGVNLPASGKSAAFKASESFFASSDWNVSIK